MFQKLGLVFRTIAHLQWKQVQYQIWYRVKSKFPRIAKYCNKEYGDFTAVTSETDNLLIAHFGKLENSLTFIFLNQTHSFSERVDWNYSSNGKLWNYNLQYLDYLHDSNIPVETRISLLEDCCNNLISGKLALEPYPVSLRLVNLVLFLSKTGYRSESVENCIQLQICFLESNLEYHIQANHLLENYIALCFVGVSYKTSNIFQKYFVKLEQTLNEQILNDGAHYECTPMYHNIILSKLLLLFDVLKNSGFELVAISFLLDKISKMIGWLNSFCFKDDSFAHVNDATDGIAPSVRNIRQAVAILKIEPTIIKFSDSGYRKILFHEFEALIDIGSIMPEYQPGHAHSDMLSFCLNFENKKVLVDSGLSTYQIGKRRQLERSTVSHNTVTIGDDNQSEVWGGFRVAKRARISCIVDKETQLSASHDGYLKKYGKIHCRSFEFDENEIVIMDELIGNKKLYDVSTARFHFDYNINVQLEETKTLVRLDDQLEFIFLGATKLCLVDYQQALGYNSYKASKCLLVEFEEKLQTQIRRN